jgi:hypothetical protein
MSVPQWYQPPPFGADYRGLPDPSRWPATEEFLLVSPIRVSILLRRSRAPRGEAGSRDREVPGWL